MNAVVKINEIRQVVDARPFDRLIRAVTGAHRLEHFRIGPELRMTTHAGLGWRKPGERRCLDGRVTVTAVDSVVPHVVFVAEGDRLIPRDANPGSERAGVETVGGPHYSTQNKYRGGDAYFRHTVRARVKDLRHSASPVRYTEAAS